MSDAHPLDDFRRLVSGLPVGNEPAAERIAARFAKAGPGALGRLGEVAVHLARWTGKTPPAVLRPQVALFAGNHGVAEARAIDSRPIGATAKAVAFCAAGGAPVAIACQSLDLGLKIFDLALDVPTGDITRQPALDARGCAATIAFGMEASAGGADLLALGDLGVGNATVAAALMMLLAGGSPADWLPAEPDAGLHGRRVEAVEAAVALHGGQGDALDMLARAGGREFAAQAGAIVAARTQRLPAIIEGPVGIAVATMLAALAPGAIDHCLLAASPAEPAFAEAARRIGLVPLIDLGMSQGNGTGAALAANLVRTAVSIAAGPMA